MRSIPPRWRRLVFAGGLVGVGIALLLAWRLDLLALQAPPPSSPAVEKAPPPAPKTAPLKGVVRDRRSTPQAGITVALYAVPLDESEPSRCGGEKPVRLFDETCAAARTEIQRRLDANELASKPLMGVETDEEGRFEFNVPPGKYDLVAVGGTRGFGLALDAAPGGEPVVIGLGQDVARGTVKDEEDFPVPEAKVAVILPRPRLVWLAESSPSGEFVVGPVPGGREMIAWAARAGFRIEKAMRGDSTEQLILELKRQRRIFGTVTLNKRPLEGVEVTHDEQPSVQTDASGRYVIEEAACGTECQVVARKGDFIGGIAQTLGGDSTVEANIELKEMKPLLVHVRDGESGFSVESQLKSLLVHDFESEDIEPLPEPSIEQIGIGEFRLRSPCARRIVLKAVAHGYAVAEVPLDCSKSPGDVTVELVRGFSLTGMVETPEGHPIAGAKVSTADTESWSDATGRFVMEHLPEGQALLLPSADGYLNENGRVEGVISWEVPSTKPLKIVLYPPSVILVKLRSEEGRPISEALVECSKASGVVKRVFTSASEARCMLVPNEGIVAVSVRAVGYLSPAPVKFDVGSQGTKDVQITLSRGLSLDGHVLDERGRPHPGVNLRFSSEPGPDARVYTAVSGANGAFHLDGLPEGALTVARQTSPVDAEGEDRRVVRAGDADVRIVVPRKARVSGVVKSDGKTVASLNVNGQSVRTVSGRFIAEVQSGSEIRLSGDFAPTKLTVTLSPGEERDLGTISVDPLGSIEGQISNVSGPGHVFVGPVRPSEDIAPVEADVDRAGRFLARQMAPGRYVVVVNTSRGEIVRECDVHAGRTTTVELALPRGATIIAPKSEAALR